MDIYLINLKDSVQRYQKISSRLNELNLPFKRVEAIYGKSLDSEYVNQISCKLTEKETSIRYPQTLTLAEIGCFLSHRICWNLLINSNEEYAIILEDDIHISDRAAKYFKSTEWIPKNLSICNISVPYNKEYNLKITSSKIIDDNSVLVNSFKSIGGTLGYVISKKYAQKAYEASERLYCPVDEFLFNKKNELPFHSDIYQLCPAIVTSNISFDSDIGNNRDIEKKKAPFWIRHSVESFLLKRRIKKLYKKCKDFTLFYK